MAKAYLVIDTVSNIVDNVVMADNSWAPPENHIAVPQTTTPAKVWEFDATVQDYVLTIIDGMGSVNFTWDGTYVITPDPKPEYTPTVLNNGQPATTGTQTL